MMLILARTVLWRCCSSVPAVFCGMRAHFRPSTRGSGWHPPGPCNEIPSPTKSMSWR